MFKITAQPVNFIFLEFIKATLFKFCYTIFLSSYFLEINTRSKYLLSVLLFLKNHTNTQYKLLIDLAAVDYPQKLHRFELVYNLLSVKMSSRLKVRVKVRSNDVLPTLSFIYKGLNWLEREIWDMFGITFENHPDLRRILNDYGFEGFPLRKDYPLVGYNEVFYDDSKLSIVHEKVCLAQEYRQFSFNNLWLKF